DSDIKRLAIGAALNEPGAKAAIVKLEREHVAAVAEVERLKLAQEQAVELDRIKAASDELASRQTQLAHFRKVLDASAKQAERFDQLAREIVSTWGKMLAAEELIVMSLPSGTSTPPGYAGVNLRRTVADAMWKHNEISAIGSDGKAFPGSEPSL